MGSVPNRTFDLSNRLSDVEPIGFESASFTSDPTSSEVTLFNTDGSVDDVEIELEAIVWPMGVAGPLDVFGESVLSATIQPRSLSMC